MVKRPARKSCRNCWRNSISTSGSSSTTRMRSFTSAPLVLLPCTEQFRGLKKRPPLLRRGFSYRGFPPGPHRFSRSASSCSQLIAKKLAVSHPNTIGELEDLHDVLLAGHIDRMLFHRSVISHC